jgi:glycosyltransferase involved in cell wall biosynthesis
MKAISVSVMRNEADIVEAFVRYHLQFLDGMFIVDHRSTDGSTEIVTKLADEGLPVVLERYEGVGFNQARLRDMAVRKSLELFRPDSPDWIVPLDLDEFVAPAGPGDIRAEIARLPSDRPAYIEWKTYIPTCSDDEGEPSALKRIGHRLENESVNYCKVIIPAVLLKRRRHKIQRGAHHLLDRKGRKV